MESTCGIYLINSEGQILLTHPTFSYNVGCWSIPKGRQDEDENYLESAMRELKEETGLSLKGKFIKLPSSDYKNKKKTLRSFLKIANEFNHKTKIKCNSYFEYKGRQLPENDHNIWIDINNPLIDVIIHETQLNNIKIIRAFING